MAGLPIVKRGSPVLGGDERARLVAAVGQALDRARERGEAVVAALTLAADPSTDPSAVVMASRGAGERFCCFEQPDRGGSAVAGVGCALALQADGPERFEQVAAEWRRCATAAVADDLGGLRALGGFAFADDGGDAPHWADFPPASLFVPEVMLARQDGEVRVTLATLVGPDDTVPDAAERVESRVAGLRANDLPLLDPLPAARSRVASTMPPAHYVSAVGRAVEQIRGGRLEKVVLAREVAVHAAAPHDPAAVFGVLREVFPSCYVVATGVGEAAFVAASPELLVRREGQRASTVALAGSTRRSADPAVDDHLGEQLRRSAKDREEQAIVARRIQRVLGSRSVWVAAAPEPALVKVANIQHLATPIRAQLAEPTGVVELAGLLHPTPAVGGEPHERALALIPALEGLDRGWYAGALGWTDATEDGEFCVGLRSALLRGEVARCYAGVGVVRDSDPAAELAETEVKLEALLPVLAA